MTRARGRRQPSGEFRSGRKFRRRTASRKPRCLSPGRIWRGIRGARSNRMQRTMPARVQLGFQFGCGLRFSNSFEGVWLRMFGRQPSFASGSATPAVNFGQRQHRPALVSVAIVPACAKPDESGPPLAAFSAPQWQTVIRSGAMLGLSRRTGGSRLSEWRSGVVARLGRKRRASGASGSGRRLDRWLVGWNDPGPRVSAARP
jgi:hypothetical protein